ncbi:uncharacterized protein LOC110598734 isoform X6 [Ictidomys tridecemlineatus]
MTRQCRLLALSGSYGRGVHGAKIQGSGFPVACALSSALLPRIRAATVWGCGLCLATCVMGAGPSATSLRNPTGVALAFRRPGGPRWKRKARRRAATPAAGSVPARRAPFFGWFSGFRGSWREGAAGIWWMEATQHPTVHGMAPFNNELSDSKCQQS